MKKHLLLLSLIAGTAFAVTPSQPPFKTTQVFVDTLTNQAGTGTPNFTNGLKSAIEASFTEISTPSSPSAGTLKVYPKTDDNLYLLNSAGVETQVGSGAGEKNYMGAGTSTSAGWTASGAGITVANDTTAADLPRPITTKTGIKVTGVSGSTAFAYYDFTLDPADYNKKLKLQFDQAPVSGYVASDFQVSVNSCTIAWSSGTCGGTSARLALSSDVSAISPLPNLTGTYRASFDSTGSTAKFIQVQIGLNGTNAHAVVFSDIIVGPGTVQQGAATDQWKTCTTSLQSTGSMTFTNIAVCRRVGDSLEVVFNSKGNSVAAGAGGSAITMLVPQSLHIDSTKTSTTGGDFEKMGVVTSYGVSSSAQLSESDIAQNDDTHMQFINPLSGGVMTTGTFNAARDMRLYGHFTVPIAEWSGSGTINVAQNDVEYAYNTSAITTGNDTTSFGYGPVGASFASVTAAGSRRVRFLTPIQKADLITVELSYNGGPFVIAGTGNATQYVDGLNVRNTTEYGIGITGVVNSTDVDVYLGQYAASYGATTYGGAGQAWSAGSINLYKWRVRKQTGGQAVGFGNVAQTGAGLVKSAGQLLGTNTNDTACAGCVGEEILVNRAFASQTGITTATDKDVMTSTLVLTPGDWEISGAIGVDFGTTPNVTSVIVSVSNNTSAVANSFYANPDPVTCQYKTGSIGSSTSTSDYGVAIPSYRCVVAAGATVSLHGIMTMTFTGGSSVAAYGFLRGRRFR